VTSVTRSYASPSIQELESSPAHRAGKKAKKREDEDTVTFRSNSTMNVEQHERQSHHLSQILEKQSSIQVTGTHLEVLSEEGDERTIKRADGMQQLLHSPSEKRYRYEHQEDSLSARRYSPGLKGKMTRAN